MQHDTAKGNVDDMMDNITYMNALIQSQIKIFKTSHLISFLNPQCRHKLLMCQTLSYGGAVQSLYFESAFPDERFLNGKIKQ